MRRLIGAFAVGAVSVLLAAGIQTSSASAQPDPGSQLPRHPKVEFFDNPTDALAGIDMRKVTMIRLKGSILVNTHFSRINHRLNGVQYYFDTNAKDPGPEFGAMAYRTKDGDGLRGLRMYRMRSWSVTGDRIPCRWHDHWYISGHNNGQQRSRGYFNTTFGLRCFESMADRRIRAHVRTWDFTRYAGSGLRRHPTRGRDDQMGGLQQYTGWI